jgi:hypothetical protein
MGIAGFGLRAEALRRVVVGCVSAAVLALAAFPVAALADFTTTEGQAFTGQVASAPGCESFMGAIDWGDGTAFSPGSSDASFGIQGTHTYADEGTYNGTLHYTCGTFVQNTATFVATVQDASLTAGGIDITGTAGQSLTTAVAHITDANSGATPGDFSVLINWGDGSSSNGSVTVSPAGGFDLLGTHTYPAAGTFPLSASVGDVGGAATAPSSTASIAVPANPPPRNTAVPLISGEPREQETLATTTGTWSGAPTSFRYQWLRCASMAGSCTALPGATASTYSPVHADVGSVLRASVLATNAVGTSLAARSAPTGLVQPLVVRARFTISPAPTCTGLRTSFDASGSKTPDPPIVRYHLRWQTLDDVVGDLIGFHYDISPDAGGSFTVPISDGSSPRASETFGWNNFYPRIGGSDGAYNVFAAFPVLVTLTVTDHAGASDTYSRELDFAQFASIEPRTGCPHQRLSHRPSASSVSLAGSRKLSVTARRVTVRVTCTSTVDCAARITLLRLSSRHHAKAKAAVLAGSRFFLVRASRSVTVPVNLTGLGRALRKRGRLVAAILRLDSVSLTGRISTRSRRVALTP